MVVWYTRRGYERKFVRDDRFHREDRIIWSFDYLHFWGDGIAWDERAVHALGEQQNGTERNGTIGQARENC